MHANSADVGGNNIPVTGGAYNADGLTVADVLSTAVATPLPAVVAAAAAAPAAAAAQPAATASTTPAPAAPASDSADDNAGAHVEHAAFHHHQMDAHVFAHMWN
jgi:hypothetical protein